jgi:hypothetical protein
VAPGDTPSRCGDARPGLRLLLAQGLLADVQARRAGIVHRLAQDGPVMDLVNTLNATPYGPLAQSFGQAERAKLQGWLDYFRGADPTKQQPRKPQ